jgi:hypothetical protein
MNTGIAVAAAATRQDNTAFQRCSGFKDIYAVRTERRKLLFPGVHRD